MAEEWYNRLEGVMMGKEGRMTGWGEVVCGDETVTSLVGTMGARTNSQIGE